MGFQLMQHVANAETAQHLSAGRLAPFALPSHLSRHWLTYTILGASLSCVCSALLRADSLLGSFLRVTSRAVLESLGSFWREHLYAPAM